MERKIQMEDYLSPIMEVVVLEHNAVICESETEQIDNQDGEW